MLISSIVQHVHAHVSGTHVQSVHHVQPFRGDQLCDFPVLLCDALQPLRDVCA